MRLSELLEQRPDLDHELEVDEGDIVTEILSLVRMVRLAGAETSDALIIGAANNTTGIVQYGIVRAAALQIEAWMLRGQDE